MLAHAYLAALRKAALGGRGRNRGKSPGTALAPGIRA
jgi:hypothetical protein